MDPFFLVSFSIFPLYGQSGFARVLCVCSLRGCITMMIRRRGFQTRRNRPLHGVGRAERLTGLHGTADCSWGSLLTSVLLTRSRSAARLCTVLLASLPPRASRRLGTVDAVTRRRRHGMSREGQGYARELRFCA